MRPPGINGKRWGLVIGPAFALLVGYLVFQHPGAFLIIPLVCIGAVMIGAVFVAVFSNISGRLLDQRTGPMPIPVLGGKSCTLFLSGYVRDKRKDEFDAAVANFLALEATALKEAEGYVFQYYQDCEAAWKSIDAESMIEPVKSPDRIWKHVRFGSEPRVFRSRYGDKGVYIAIGCGCDWEPEHGMEIVFKNGLKLIKVGPEDGNSTNADDSGDESHNTIYKA